MRNGLQANQAYLSLLLPSVSLLLQIRALLFSEAKRSKKPAWMLRFFNRTHIFWPSSPNLPLYFSLLFQKETGFALDWLRHQAVYGNLRRRDHTETRETAYAELLGHRHQKLAIYAWVQWLQRAPATKQSRT